MSATDRAVSSDPDRASMMMEVLRDLVPLDRVMCSPDYDRTIEYLKQRFPLTELAYGPGAEHNGWVIPPSWEALESRIEKDGKLVYDGKWHPVATMALSAPFEGTVDLDPALTRATRLADLNGARGLGASTGEIVMRFNAGPPLTIDLTGAVTVGNVNDKITAAAGDIAAFARVSPRR